MSESINSLLLEILTAMGEVKGDLRTIEGRLAVGTERHRDFAKSLDAIDLRVASLTEQMQKIPPLVIVVDDMAPKVKSLMEFRGRMAAIIVVASMIVGSAFSLIWEGIKFFTPDIRSMFEHFH
jgi:hypothetical protein